MSTNYLVNGVYPPEYLGLSGVDKIQYPNQYWWASKQRYAEYDPSSPDQYLKNGVSSSEILEIDLGRTRQINHISFDVFKVPVDIAIQYDSVSLPDGTHSWTDVRPLEDMPFDKRVFYEASTKNQWQTSNFYFTDDSRELISARYIRIVFTRRAVKWPTRGTKPFQWSVLVKDLRTAHYISDTSSSAGLLFDTTSSDVGRKDIDIVGNQTAIVAQRFVMPENYMRGSISPSMLGFSFLVGMSAQHSSDYPSRSDIPQPKWFWSLHDVTDSDAGTMIYQGVINRTNSDTDKGWLDARFNRSSEVRSTTKKSCMVKTGSRAIVVQGGTADLRVGDSIAGPGISNGSLITYINAVEQYVEISQEAILTESTMLTFTRISSGQVSVPTSLDRIYEVRLFSSDTSISSALYVQNPNRLPGRSLPGLYSFVNDGSNNIVKTTEDPSEILSIGDYFQKTSGVDSTPSKVVFIDYNMGEQVWDITIDGPYQGISEASVTASKIFPLSIGGIYQPSIGMVLRAFGDVAEEGRDILGNSYRYATVRNSASSVTDPDSAGWMSAPQPDPRAVESLYFDVRAIDSDRNLNTQVIDSIRIAPRTPGVNMHVYYTDIDLGGRTPNNIDEWDRIEWTPINQMYTLRNKATYSLPRPIKASYVKLEFSSLTPLPIKIPTRPKIPPVEFRRYPTWVEVQFYDPAFDGYQRVVTDWFVRNQTVAMKKMLRTLTDPVAEFQYEQREFLAALALGKITKDNFGPDVRTNLDSILDIKNHALIDPVTKSRIYFATNDMYKGPLTATVDQTSLLGQIVANRYDPILATPTYEGANSRPNNTTVVSTVNDRISESYQTLTRIPMWFNRRCLHLYKTEKAQFNKKAYFVGIKSVEFFRTDYTNVRDDDVIMEIMNDLSNMIVDPNNLSAFVKVPSTRIPSD